MTCREHLYTKQELEERGLTKEAFIVHRINNIKSLSTIFGLLDNHISDEVLRHRIFKTIEIILNDQEKILYGAMSNYITFQP